MSVKHSGCAICKKKDQEILTSIIVTGDMGTAVCDKCKEQIEGNKK